MTRKITISILLATVAAPALQAQTQTVDAPFKNAYGALSVRGSGQADGFSSFSLGSSQPSGTPAIRTAYSVSPMTDASQKSRPLYYVVPRLPVGELGLMGGDGPDAINFASYGLKTEASLISLMSATFMANNIGMNRGEDGLAKFFNESQQAGQNFYLTAGSNIDPSTGIMRVTGKDGRVSLMIPSSVLLGMARTDSRYQTRASGLLSSNRGGGAGRSGNGGNGGAGGNGGFGSISLDGDSDDLNVFSVSEADLKSSSAVVVSAPDGSEIMIKVDKPGNGVETVGFDVGGDFPHEFIAPISGSLAGYAAGAGGGLGSTQLTSLPNVNGQYTPTNSPNYSSPSGGGAAGGGIHTVSYVPENKSLGLLIFGMAAMTPLVRKRKKSVA